MLSGRAADMVCSIGHTVCREYGLPERTAIAVSRCCDRPYTTASLTLDGYRVSYTIDDHEWRLAVNQIDFVEAIMKQLAELLGAKMSEDLDTSDLVVMPR